MSDANPSSSPTPGPQTPDDFYVEDSAIARLVQMVHGGDLIPPTGGLRISVRGGGCSGLTYHMDWVSNPQVGDQTIERAGVRVFVDRKSQLFLRGSTLSYVQDLQSAGFKVQNPNARSTCGCGESFST